MSDMQSLEPALGQSLPFRPWAGNISTPTDQAEESRLASPSLVKTYRSLSAQAKTFAQLDGPLSPEHTFLQLLTRLERETPEKELAAALRTTHVELMKMGAGYMAKMRALGALFNWLSDVLDEAAAAHGTPGSGRTTAMSRAAASLVPQGVCARGQLFLKRSLLGIVADSLDREAGHPVLAANLRHALHHLPLGTDHDHYRKDESARVRLLDSIFREVADRVTAATAGAVAGPFGSLLSLALRPA